VGKLPKVLVGTNAMSGRHDFTDKTKRLLALRVSMLDAPIPGHRAKQSREGSEPWLAHIARSKDI
jgi:hypothetical protein